MYCKKKALRAIAAVSYDFHTAGLFKKFRVLNAHALYDYRLSTSLKIEQLKDSTFLTDLGNLSKNVHNYPTRGAECWEVATPRTNYGKQMLKYTLPNLLNSYKTKSIDWDKLSLREVKSSFFSSS